MRPLRILIADDHEAVRLGVRSLLSSNSAYVLCGEATTGLEAAEKARELHPDVILMDISMPDMDGLEATRVIRRELPRTHIYLVSQNDPTLMQKQALRAGAQGFIPKSRLSEDLFGTLERLAEDLPQEQQERRKSPGVASSKTDLDFLADSGEMAQRMRELDWSRTPLGPISRWPQSLKTSVSICLASRFPIVMYWGPEFVVLYNDAYSTILGSKHPWALGQACRDCWGEIWDTIGPMLDGVVSSAQATWSDDLLLMLRRHGYSEECYFSFSFSPIRVETGAVGGVFTAVMETTDKVIGERRLRTLRDLAATAVNAHSEDDAWRISAETLAKNLHDVPFSIICRVNENGTVQVLGASSIEISHPFCELLADAESGLAKNVRRAARSREISQVRLADVGQDHLPMGAWQASPENLLLLPIPSLGSEHTSIVLLAGLSPHKRLDESYRTFFQLLGQQIANSAADARSHDEQRRRVEALAELDRAKTQFFSNVSHEFRTPLTLMLGPLEDTLTHRERLQYEDRERLELAHRNSLRLLKLVNTLLDFSRIEAGRVEASYEATELCALTVDFASVFRSAIERAGVRLVTDCKPVTNAYVDREMWEKIVLNLLSNAFKFTFEGEIKVALREVGRFAELTVSDTGTGIPKSEIPRLFERFHRVSGARGRSYEGSGIGLALVQELVKLHGGTVKVESQVDRGSSLTVTIPLGKDHLPADRIGAARTAASTGLRGEAYVQEAMQWLPNSGYLPSLDLAGSLVHAEPAGLAPSNPEGNPRILLAEDNQDMREYVRRLLREEYEVIAVSDGKAALESARKQRPDLILSDIMMPGLDGFGLLQAVRAEGELKNIPVILLSARAGEESRVGGLDAGADDYLVKPFSARELLARIRSHLTMAKMRQQAAERDRATSLLAAIVGSSDDAIISKNLDGTITSWNKAAERLFGYTAKEAIGQHISLIVPQDRREEEARILSQLRRGERLDHFETIRQRKNGSMVELSLTISPVRDSKGRVVGASNVARDISERKLAERELRESEQRFRNLSETLDAEVRSRTKELEDRNADVLRQSELLRELSRRLLQAQDEQRRHIARELHDSAGQTLTVLGMNVAQLLQKQGHHSQQLAEELEKIQQGVRQLHNEIRTASYLLHPPLLDESGLSSALGWYVDGLADRSGLEISFDISEDFGRLPSDMELVAFRVVQECLTNIHRHSGSSTAFIHLVRESDQVTIEVRDQGKGMSAEKLAEIQSHGSGVGIRGMRERLRQFGGILKIDSGPQGTTVTANIPLPAANARAESVQVQPAQLAV